VHARYESSSTQLEESQISQWDISLKVSSWCLTWTAEIIGLPSFPNVFMTLCVNITTHFKILLLHLYKSSQNFQWCWWRTKKKAVRYSVLKTGDRKLHDSWNLDTLKRIWAGRRSSTPSEESGFGCLVVSMLASGTQDREFEPGRNRRNFWAKKSDSIHNMPSFGGEVKPSVPCRSFAACNRSLRFTRKSESQANWPAISHPIPTFTNRGLSCRLTWSASGDDGRN
jgi:hypothetical protein